MPHATCAHCNVSITDHSTMVERDGKTFCCNNCASMMSGQASQGSGPTCAHCHSTITDTSTLIQRDGMTFCCNNCAMAMAAGAGHQTH